MHRWTRSCLTASAALLIFICLISLFGNASSSTHLSDSPPPSSDSHRQSTSWSEWAWLKNTKSNATWFQFLSHNQDLENEANRWTDGTSQNSDGRVSAEEQNDDSGPTWLDEITDKKGSTHEASDNAGNAPISTVTVTEYGFVPPPAATASPLPGFQGSFAIDKNTVFSPDGPRPDQVVIVTASDGKGHNSEIKNILTLAAENRKAYCDYHGYHCYSPDIAEYDLGDAPPAWKKIPALISAFNAYPQAQWLFFLDLDAIIMSGKQDLNSLVLSHKGMLKSLKLGEDFRNSNGEMLPYTMSGSPNLNELDLLIAQDHNGLNAGSFFLRRSEWTRDMLDYMTDPFFVQADFEQKEQETLMHLIRHHSTFRSRVGLLKMRTMNSYPIGEDNEELGWRKGDLVVHFAGCWVDGHCQQRWDQYWVQRDILS